MKAIVMLFSALILIAGVFLLAGIEKAQAQTTWWVVEGATPPGDGSKGNPFPNIQDGIDAASAGDQVRVNYGTYYENISLKSGVEITIHTDTNPTIIDGSNNGSPTVTAINIDSNCKLIGFTITNGTAAEGGGLYLENSDPEITDCTITGNTGGTGGGMHNYNSSPTVTDCIFDQNEADAGAGIYNNNSAAQIDRCWFTDNTAGSDGGGIYTTGSSSLLEVTNCVFVGNEATFNDGGAIVDYKTASQYINCTIVGNQATDYGGGLYADESAGVFTNCIFWSNRAGISGDEIYETGGDRPTVTYSDVNGGYTGNGNINVIPDFVDMGNRDFRLLSTSQCIDVGSNPAVAAVPSDFEGDTRQFDGDGNSSVIVDIGADEYVSPAAVWVDDDYCSGCGNDGHAWKFDAFDNIPEALSLVAENGTVYIQDGVYTEPNTALTKNITLNGQTQVNTIIQAGTSPQAATDRVITVSPSVTVTIRDMTIRNGDASDLSHEVGGGIYCQGSLTLQNSTISSNLADNGGGIYFDGGISVNLISCTFTDNYAQYLGGGIYNNSDMTATGCSFINNTAASQGGGGIHNEYSSPVIEDCSFSGNQTISAPSYGGGMRNDSGTPTVTNCVFYDNTTGDRGGGLYNDHSAAVITNCSFYNNDANRWGGGICNYYSWPLVTNCSFSLNTAEYGCGLYDAWCEATVTNCIFWNNLPDEICPDWSTAITFCDVQGGYTGTGNFEADPQWVNPGSGDFHLQETSPCIDAGSNSAIPAAITEDFKGDARIQSGRIDVGIDETPYDSPEVTTDPATQVTGVSARLHGTLISMGDEPSVDVYFEWDSDMSEPFAFRTGTQTLYNPGTFSSAITGLKDAWTHYFRAVATGSGNAVGATIDFTTPAVEEFIYVNAANTGTKNGESWATAFDSLQDALDAADAEDQIWVASGTYVPTLMHGGTGARYVSFEMKNNVGIYGGFPATGSPTWNQRDWQLHETILSGDILGDDNDVVMGSGGGVWADDCCDAQPVNDGTTAFDTTTATTDYQGDCDMEMDIWYTYTPTYTGTALISLCGSSFDTKLAVYPGTPCQSGTLCCSGTMIGCNDDYCDVQSRLSIGVISGESYLIQIGGYSDSEYGPGILTVCRDIHADNAYHVFFHCSDLLLNDTAVLDGFTITRGYADNDEGENDCGGGMYNEYDISATVKNCLFEDNYALSYGGGMHNYWSSPTVTNCVFSGNEAVTYGAGMYNYNGSAPTITGCTFIGNSVVEDGGGMMNYAASLAQVINCTFVNNAAQRGAGLLNANSDATVTNCTFYGNKADEGGGIYNSSSEPEIINCILWENKADQGNQIHGWNSFPIVNYCDIQVNPGSPVYPGTGNISIDPEFVHPSSGDFHLKGTSPCVDSGSNGATSGIVTDFEGDARIIDGDAIPGAVVDIGADEFDPAAEIMVKIIVALQGANRPNLAGWQVPLIVAFFNPGSDVMADTPVHSFTATAVAEWISGGTKATITVGPVNPGIYDITADSITTLLNVKRNIGIW